MWYDDKRTIDVWLKCHRWIKSNPQVPSFQRGSYPSITNGVNCWRDPNKRNSVLSSFNFRKFCCVQRRISWMHFFECPLSFEGLETQYKKCPPSFWPPLSWSPSFALCRPNPVSRLGHLSFRQRMTQLFEVWGTLFQINVPPQNCITEHLKCKILPGLNRARTSRREGFSHAAPPWKSGRDVFSKGGEHNIKRSPCLLTTFIMFCTV